MALVADLTDARTAYLAAINNNPPPLPGSIQEEKTLKDLKKIARDTMSQSSGYLLEWEIHKKHRDKGRSAFGTSQTKQADVLIGDGNEEYSKSIQAKAVTTDEPDAVSKHIKTALGQLVGISHKGNGNNARRARDNDRWLVYIKVLNGSNPWPYRASDQAPATVLALKNKIMEDIKFQWESLTPNWDKLRLVRAKPNARVRARAVPKHPLQHALATHTLAGSDGGLRDIAAANRPHSTAVYQNTGVQGQYIALKKDTCVKVVFEPCFTIGNVNVKKVVTRIRLVHNIFQYDVDAYDEANALI